MNKRLIMIIFFFLIGILVGTVLTAKYVSVEQNNECIEYLKENYPEEMYNPEPQSIAGLDTDNRIDALLNTYDGEEIEWQKEK